MAFVLFHLYTYYSGLLDYIWIIIVLFHLYIKYSDRRQIMGYLGTEMGRREKEKQLVTFGMVVIFIILSVIMDSWVNVCKNLSNCTLLICAVYWWSIIPQ